MRLPVVLGHNVLNPNPQRLAQRQALHSSLCGMGTGHLRRLLRRGPAPARAARQPEKGLRIHGLHWGLECCFGLAALGSKCSSATLLFVS